MLQSKKWNRQCVSSRVAVSMFTLWVGRISLHLYPSRWGNKRQMENGMAVPVFKWSHSDFYTFYLYIALIVKNPQLCQFYINAKCFLCVCRHALVRLLIFLSASLNGNNGKFGLLTMIISLIHISHFCLSVCVCLLVGWAMWCVHVYLAMCESLESAAQDVI